ncbi:hypothetical protein [Streptomyces netropsis]|uniref:Uncharacterized protein n=1 Tax=Streptomyces netropsis TaxID=55404 RepID=A0A7W7PIS5_STRNE|nr:hypothetical protein [Streptomyces netropsis]MBB4890090.1 hypothetical protein [Streptomyces netropsis]GGR43222.1 hypothetical protein GCM10010219_55960 [Streptomyces netropsis]
MLLAIGDVVRVRHTAILGTVVGISTGERRGAVQLQVSGNLLQNFRPRDLELVARGFKPAGGLRALIFFVFGVTAAVMNGLTAQSLGAGPLVTALVSIATATTISGGLFNLSNRPRRVRV